MPSHISRVEPLRPLWPSWRPIAAPGPACTKSVTRRQEASCPSFHRPAQPGVIRPSGLTQTISVMTRPAPPRARAPRWTRWKSPGVPSAAEYMSIGETTTRLRRVSPRRVKGVNIGGVSGPVPNSRSTEAVKSASRSRRLSWVTRRLRVSRLKANCRGGWAAYCSRFSNHSRLARAARCVLATTGLRSAS